MQRKRERERERERARARARERERESERERERVCERERVREREKRERDLYYDFFVFLCRWWLQRGSDRHAMVTKSLRNLNTTQEFVDKTARLKEDLWLDLQTRGVFVTSRVDYLLV
jgi:hypothetical protein